MPLLLRVRLAATRRALVRGWNVVAVEWWRLRVVLHLIAVLLLLHIVRPVQGIDGVVTLRLLVGRVELGALTSVD